MPLYIATVAAMLANAAVCGCVVCQNLALERKYAALRAEVAVADRARVRRLVEAECRPLLEETVRVNRERLEQLLGNFLINHTDVRDAMHRKLNTQAARIAELESRLQSHEANLPARAAKRRGATSAGDGASSAAAAAAAPPG